MSRMTLSQRSAVLAVAALSALGLVLSGCASSPGNAQTKDGRTAVTIALVKVGGAAPVYIAEKQGFFADEGLDVTIREVPGPATVAALQNGEVQFASLGASVAIAAVSQGIPLAVISGRTQTAPSAEADETPVMVMDDSAITSAAQLDGKTIGTQTLTSQNTIMTKAAIARLGGDVNSMKFVDISFPDMAAALRSGSIQAAAVSEPFATAMEKKGARRVFGSGYNAFPDDPAPVGVIAVKQDYAKAHADTVAAFTQAFDKAVEWAKADEGRLRTTLSDLIGLPAADVKDMRLPTFDTTVTQSGMEELAGQLVTFGVISKAPSMEHLVP